MYKKKQILLLILLLHFETLAARATNFSHLEPSYKELQLLTLYGAMQNLSNNLVCEYGYEVLGCM